MLVSMLVIKILLFFDFALKNFFIIFLRKNLVVTKKECIFAE